MSNNYLANIIRFFSLILVQVFVLNEIQFGGYINPLLYVYFILLLPFETPGWLLLTLSFAMGISIDFFSETLGVHAAASTLMAFFRPLVLRMISSRQDYEQFSQPSIKNFGFIWFLSYTLILILIHHTAYFYLEIFRFTELFSTFFRVLVSSFFTLTIVILSQYLFYKSKK